MESRKNSKYFPSPPNGLLAWAFTVTLPFRSNDLNSYDFSKEYLESLMISNNTNMLTDGPAKKLLMTTRIAGSSLDADAWRVIRTPQWLLGITSILPWLSPVLVVLFALTFSVHCFCRSAMVLPGIVVAFLFSAPFGNALAVSVIHSLDIVRYRQTYGPFLLLALAAMAGYVILSTALFLRQPASKNPNKNAP